MRLIALEEHYEAPMLKGRLGWWAERGAPSSPSPIEERRAALHADVGAGRLADMDAAQIDMQVLSHSGGIEQLDPAEAVPLAREANAYLGEQIRANPDRLAGFASLPTSDPEAAATELETAVREDGLKGALINGHSHGRFLDDPSFTPLFEAAEALDVPVYLHPGEPPQAVFDAYYGGLTPVIGMTLSTAAWGWHVDAGLHALRMIVGGVFERFPRLQLILGHMGEGLPFFLARTEEKLKVVGCTQSVSETVADNFHFTISGMFTYPPLLCLLEVVGADRVMFAVDYPISDNARGPAFLHNAPVSEADKEKIAHLNAERLLGINGTCGDDR